EHTERLHQGLGDLKTTDPVGEKYAAARAESAQSKALEAIGNTGIRKPEAADAVGKHLESLGKKLTSAAADSAHQRSYTDRVQNLAKAAKTTAKVLGNVATGAGAIDRLARGQGNVEDGGKVLGTAIRVIGALRSLSGAGALA